MLECWPPAVGYANAENAGTSSANYSNNQRSGEEHQSAVFGPLLPEVQEACLDLQRGGRLDGSPLQAYSTTHESIAALQVALAVVQHNLPGLETQTCNPSLSNRPMQSFVSAAAQLEALTASLRESVRSLSSKADPRITRFPALLRRLY